MAADILAHPQTLISLEEARRLGLKRYFTGKPCKHGHIAERSVSKSSCLTCKALSETPKEKAVRDAKYRARNKERITAQRAKYLELNRERIYKANSDRYAIDPSVAKACMRRWYEANASIASARAAKWNKENPESKRASARNRRARLTGSEGSHTLAEVHALLAQQKHRCASCKTSIRKGYEEDHIVPLALDGSNDIHNIQLLCMPCNRRKGAKHPLDWAQLNGRLL